MKIWTYLLSAGLAGFALGSAAIAEEDIASKMINKETNGAWYFQPDKPKAKHVKADVPGEYAFRVKATKRTNPWEIQATSPIAGAIHEGDVIMLNYFARAEVPAEGGSSLSAQIQLAAAPYSSVLQMTSKISGEWKSYCGFRVASASIEEKKSNVTVHLASATQVIDLGPVLVFNFGKGYDTAKLKFCDG
jgi:hypothetical protein